MILISCRFDRRLVNPMHAANHINLFKNIFLICFVNPFFAKTLTKDAAKHVQVVHRALATGKAHGFAMMKCRN